VADQGVSFFREIKQRERGLRKATPFFPSGTGRKMQTATDADFEKIVRVIRERDEEACTGFWFNLIQYRRCRFIQGSVVDEDSPRGTHRDIALLSDRVTADDIAGFWPEIPGHPVTPSEERRLVAYLSTRPPDTVELIVPERNVSRPVDWDIFENAREFEIYRDHIYPEIIKIMGAIISRDRAVSSVPPPARRSRAQKTLPLRVLDLGCGSGNLIEAIYGHFRRKGGALGPAGTAGPGSGAMSPFQCYGVDVSEENVEAARNRGLENVFEGDAEKIDEIFPPGLTFDLILFCGLLNRQVVPTREKARAILGKALERLRSGGHVIVTGYTSCHLTAEDLDRSGLEVLQKCLPRNLFKDYDRYFLRQLYTGRKKPS